MNNELFGWENGFLLESRSRGFVRLIVGFFILLWLSPAVLGDEIFINERWPIKGREGPVLSPPHVEATNECAKNVYVDSFIPKATITIYRGGSTVIGGPVVSEFGFMAVPLTVALNAGDQITATQTVNSVVSAHSAPMVVGKMPASLKVPNVDAKIYACGRVAPVQNLVSGVDVEVIDSTAGSTIGIGSTPNLWGSDWDPVVTSSLVAGHKITARQSACTGVKSPDAAPETVLTDPSPLPAPSLDPPIIGNDAITAHGLLVGADLKAFQPGPIGSGFATGSDNWMHVSPPIKSTPGVTAEQDLCSKGPSSKPQNPTDKIPAPVLIGPICPKQTEVFVTGTTINATLVLLKNGTVVGYGGAAPGKVPLDIAPPASFAQNDTVQVMEYIGNQVVASNTVNVDCSDTKTYHDDSLRTGWYPFEKTLTPANVTQSTFGLLKTVQLDDQVDTQPLVIASQPIAGMGVHTVVYVTTEANTVYAIDAVSGGILKSVNLGTPVKQPLGCGNNGPTVGINGTSTIDPHAQTLYVMAYTQLEGGATPVFRLHALDLSTLTDKPGSPITVTASHALSGGGTFNFNAKFQRQRSALLQSRGNIYAAFASFCDFSPDQSRGWVLGWNAATLAPLPVNELTNTLKPPASSYYLASIWMSGYGLAAEPADGDLFFVTGNSDPGKNTYDGSKAIQESVVKMTSDLSKVLDLFTPANEFNLDQADLDYGSGGAMIVPDQPGPVPKLVVAAGKDGRMFILDRSKLGEFHSPDKPAFVPIGECWCGPSYFQGADGIGRVVSSGGNQVKSWRVNTSHTPALQLEAASPALASGQDGGFFTTVSSNDKTHPVIWAVSHPTGADKHITLYAFNGTASGSSLHQLFAGTAGSWPYDGGNANLVPTVANGQVYVASYKRLAIFGLKHGGMAGAASAPLRFAEANSEEVIAPAPTQPKPEGTVLWGTIEKIHGGGALEIKLRDGSVQKVDLNEAQKNGTTINPVVGVNVVVKGKLSASGVLEALIMQRAKIPENWGEDYREEGIKSR